MLKLSEIKVGELYEVEIKKFFCYPTGNHLTSEEWIKNVLIPGIKFPALILRNDNTMSHDTNFYYYSIVCFINNNSYLIDGKTNSFTKYKE